MKTYAIVHQSLDLVEKFEKENDREPNLYDFAGFLNHQIELNQEGADQKEIRFGNQETPAKDLAFKLDNNISRLLIFMYRYAKSYLKRPWKVHHYKQQKILHVWLFCSRMTIFQKQN